MIQSGDLIHSRFVVIGQINRGRFGLIYYTRTGTMVVMKVPKFGEDYDLEREYNFLTQLAPYTYTPSPFEFGRNAQFSYFFMSQEGQSLQDLASIFTAGFDERTIGLLLFHCLLAVHNVHQLGVCHADITLMNLCLSLTPLKGRILLIDFGDAIAYNDIAHRNDISAIFMSLEFVSNHHLMLGECRRLHNQDTPSPIEDILEFIREQPNFNERDHFMWEG